MEITKIQKGGLGAALWVAAVVLVGVVHFRPEHGVKRRLSGSGGRPCEETGRDVRLRAHFPQLTQGARRIFQEGKLVDTKVSSV